MPAPRSQQDLIVYIAELESRIKLLEQSVTRIDRTSSRASLTAAKGRIIYDTSDNKLYGGNGTVWTALF